MVARGELLRDADGLWTLPRPKEAVAAPATSGDRPDRFPATGTLREGRDRLVGGRLDVHRDGFGFVRPDPGGAAAAGDIFIPPNELNGAMQGDQVLVD